MQTLIVLMFGAVLLLYGLNSILMMMMRMVYGLMRNLMWMMILVLLALFALSNHLVYVP